jgi:hypothetical protein
MLAHRQVGEEAAHLLGSKAGCRAAADKTLKPGNPETVGLQGSGGVVAEEDRRLEVAVFLLPGSAASWRRWCGRLCARQGGIGERGRRPVLVLGACGLRQFLPCRERRPRRWGGPRCLGWDRGHLPARAQSPLAAAREHRRSGVEGWARVASGRCRERRAGGARFRGRLDQQLHGSGSLASLGHGLVLGGELGQAKSRGVTGTHNLTTEESIRKH